MNLQGAITEEMTKFSCSDEAQLLAIGRQLGPLLEKGDVIALTGDLGAGKTTLVRGLIQAFIADEEVPSPTYTLVQTYDLPNYELWHCDLYRLKHPDEVFELGLVDVLEDVVSFIEWPYKMGQYLPQDALPLHIKFVENGREVIFGNVWADRRVESLINV
jgi:tRNA threonylcarbamoyladenosine biosynthesis protein TsaE